MVKIDNNNFIHKILKKTYTSNLADEVYKNSFLIRYLDKKTHSAYKSSKSRSSFANIYAIYVLVKDYQEVILSNKSYVKYDGMRFSDALRNVRELPWGNKLQNHALNSRLNEEFRKFFGNETNALPIRRDLNTKRYWFNDKLLRIKASGKDVNITDIIIKIIDQYIYLKQENYSKFIKQCKSLQNNFVPTHVHQFINSILSEDTDARLFEVVSYCILKQYYKNIEFDLYRTGRTNANDGGIDFVLKPEGRLFQVTEVFDFEKYFLDIEKLLHYPITFVIRTELSSIKSWEYIKKNAESKYSKEVLKKYLDCFEEIITLPVLRKYLSQISGQKEIRDLLNELILQYQIEYNIKDS